MMFFIALQARGGLGIKAAVPNAFLPFCFLLSLLFDTMPLKFSSILSPTNIICFEVGEQDAVLFDATCFAKGLSTEVGNTGLCMLQLPLKVPVGANA